MSVLSRMYFITFRCPRYLKHQTRHYSPTKGFRPRDPEPVAKPKIEVAPEQTSPTPQPVYPRKPLRSDHSQTRVLPIVVYTAVAIPTIYAGCSIWHYESLRNAVQKRLKPEEPNKTHKSNGFRDHMNMLWNSLTPGRKLVVGIISANVAIFSMWKVPSLRPFLTRYFVSSPLKGHSVLATTLCAFSHKHALHLVVNMYVLWNFSGILTKMMGKEQFVATFISGATFSSMISCLSKAMRGQVVGSVGASGGLFCLLVCFCVTFPEAELTIALLGEIFPISFSASNGITAAILFDSIGWLLNWKILDHAGHLGGSAFGGLYYYLDKKGYVKKFRHRILDVWHRLRR